MALILKPVEAARGPRWVADAFRLYMRRPFGFALLFVIFLIAAMLISLVPLLGAVVQMMSLPLLSLGFMVAGQAVLLGGSVHPKQLIEPLRTSPARRRALLILCAMYGVAAIAVLLLADAVSNHALDRMQVLLARGESAQVELAALFSEPQVAAGMLLAAGLGTLVSAPFWHAPALVHWGGQGVRQALFSSSLAVWRSKGAFFTYGMAWIGVMLAFGVFSAFLLGLLGAPQLSGMLALLAGLVFTTIFYLSVLFTFTDSFAGTPTLPDLPG